MALKPTVITNPHPLLGDGRQYYYSTFVKGETLGQYCLRNHVCIPRSNVAVFVNGVRLIDDWERFIPEQGDRIIFRTMAYGRGGRKIASIVAMIALAVAAPHLAAYMGFTQGTVAFGLATGAIMMAGSLLINAILPPIKPAQLGNKEKEQSPTYGINAGRNQISQYSPMIVVFGTHKVVPFHASKPYTTFAGNDQYLSQAFHFGLQTDLDIQQLKIGKTLIGDYRNVQIQRSSANGDLSLVAGNVDTLDGYEFGYADGWTVRTSPLDTEFIDVDIAATLYNINDSGDEREQAVTIEAQYSKKGLNQWRPLGGNYTTMATHYWSLGFWITESGGGRDTDWTRQRWVQSRFGSINPNDHTEGELEEVVTNRTYNYLSRETITTTTRYIWRWVSHPAAGAIKQPWQGIAPSPYTTYTGTGVQEIKGRNPQQPSRVTMSASVTRGEYDVRVRKVSTDISTSRSSNKTSVAQLRFTQADDADYDGQCRMAVRIKASSQLHGAIDELSAICSASCLVWKNGTWVNEKTSNPAWWYLHWALGRYDKQFNRLYGEGLPWSRIDVEGIKAWAAFCDAKQLRFNWVLDRKMSIEDVYYTIARAGRASVTWQTGKRGVIFDSASIPVTTMITPANIKAGSYEYTYINTQVADEIIINFYNAAKDYEKDVVRQRVPGVPEFNNPITLDLEGCTNVSQAGREANLLAASQHFHRKQHRWEMDVEGMLAVRGDVVEFSHDLNNWGQSGRLLSVSGNSLVLDGYVQGVASGWLSLRSPNNKIAYLRTNGSGNTDTLTVIGSLPAGFVPPTEETAIDYMWQYNPLKLAGKKLHIKKVEPKDSNTFAFEAIEYIPEYYASEGNPYRYVENTSSVANQSLIRVLGVTSSERNINEARGTVDVHFAWTLSEKCPANVIVYLNGDALRTSVGITSNQIVVNAREGDLIDIEIHPDKRGRAVESYHYQHLVVGKLDILPAPTGLEVVGEFTKKSLKVKWNRVINAVGYRVAIYTNGALLRMLNVGNVLTYEYTAADMQLDGGTGRTVMVRVKALGAKNVESGWAEISATNPQIGQLQGVEVEGLVKSIMFTCTKPSDEDFAGYLFWISDSQSFTPTLANVHFDGNFNQYFFERFNNQPLEQKDYYIWAAGYDTFGKDSLSISPSYMVRPLVLQLDPQSIANEMIKDGAFTITKFADNIKPPVVVDEFPENPKEYDRVVLTSDGKTYQYINGEWSNRISVDDLEGRIEAPQLSPELNDAIDLIFSTDSAVQGIQTDLVDEIVPAIINADNLISINTSAINNAKSDIGNLFGSIGTLDGLINDLSIGIGEQDARIAALQAELSDLVGLPDWDANETYLAGQIVKGDNALYRAKQDVPNGTPVSDTNFWEKIGNYGSIGEAVASLLARMSTSEAHIDDITGEIVAQSQELLALQSDLTDLDSEVSGQATAIDNLETSVTAIDGKVTAQAQSINSLSASFNNQVIGGRNLLLGTNNAQFSSFGNRSYTQGSNNLGLRTHRLSASGDAPFGFVFDVEGVASGQEYTLSFVGQGAFNRLDYCILSNGVDDDFVLPEWGFGSGSSTRRAITFTAPWSSGNNVQITIGSVNRTSSAWFIVSGVQLEQGTVSSSWQPNPSDISNEFDSISAEMTATNTVVANNHQALTNQLTTHVSEYNSNKSSVQGQITTLSNADSSITQRLDTHVSEYNSNKASVNSQITTLSNAQSAQAQSINSLSASFNNQVIGGRNLLLGTNNAQFSSFGNRSYTQGSNNLGLRTHRLSASGDAPFGFVFDVEGVASGQEYTLSFVGQGAFNRLDYCILSNGVDDDFVLPEWGFGSGSSTRRAITFTAPWSSGNNVQITIGSVNRTSSAWFIVSGVQLEQGTVSSSWQPNPSDISNEFDSISAEMTATNTVVANNHQALTNQLTTHVSEYNSNKSSVQGQITTLSNADSSITQRLDTHVSEYNSNKASVNSQITTLSNAQSAQAQAHNTLKAEFNSQEIGGRNLIPKSDKFDAFRRWLHRGSLFGYTASENSQGFRLSIHNSSGHGIVSASGIELLSGRTYTLSFRGQGTFNSLNYCYLVSDSNSNHRLESIPLGSEGNTKRTLTFEAPWSAKDVSVLIGAIGRGSGDWFEFYQLQLEMGNTSTEWTPNPDDFTSAIADVSAEIAATNTVVANNKQAATQALNTHISEYNSNKSSVQGQITTLSNEQGALSSSLTTLSSAVGGHTTTISTQASSIDGLEGQVFQKINNNGYITGWGLASTTKNGTPTSAFKILSDTLVLGDPKTPDVNPFRVETNGSNSRLVLDGNIIATGSVTTNALGANSVTAGKVAAGAIGADQISAGAITSSKLTVTDFTNLVLNGQFLESDQGWDNVLRTSSTQIPSGFEGRFQRRDAYYGNFFPVVSGEVFRVSADIWRFNTPIASCSVGLNFIRSDGSHDWIGGFTVADPGSWSPVAYSGLVTVPANVVSARFWVQYNISGSDHQTSNFWRGANFQLNRAMTGELIVDGSIKTQHMTTNSIQGDRIAANTLNGDRVITNTLHANRIIAGTITAASGIIADAAITNAEIANLAVNRIKIADGSVTVGNRWTTNGHVAEGAGGTGWVRRWSTAIAPSPWAVFLVRVSMTKYGGTIFNASVQVLAGTTPLAGVASGNTAGGTFRSPWAIHVAPSEASISVETSGNSGGGSYSWDAEIVILQTFK